MMRLTPTAVAALHPRGVFQDEHTFDGLVVYRVYDCTGQLVEIATVSARWNDADIAKELTASLGVRCPVGEHCHPGDQPAPRPMHII